MSRQPDGNLVVGMNFEDDDQASENLQPRTNLADVPAPGQSGTYQEADPQVPTADLIRSRMQVSGRADSTGQRNTGWVGWVGQ